MASRSSASRAGLRRRCWPAPAARLVGLVGLAQLAGAQQRHARLAREPPDHFGDDAFGQLRLLQPLGEAAEREPGLQLARDLAVVHESLQQLRGLLRVARADADHAKRQAPAIVVAGFQQRAEVLARPALVAQAQRQAGLGGQQGQASVTVLAPQLQGLGGTGFVPGQQRDAGRAFGQRRHRRRHARRPGRHARPRRAGQPATRTPPPAAAPARGWWRHRGRRLTTGAEAGAACAGLPGNASDNARVNATKLSGCKAVGIEVFRLKRNLGPVEWRPSAASSLSHAPERTSTSNRRFDRCPDTK